MTTFDIVKNTLYYLVISAIYLTPSTALISSGQICPSAPWCSTFREILFSEISYLKYVTLVHQRAEGGSVVEVSVEFTTWGLKAQSIMSKKTELVFHIKLLLFWRNISTLFNKLVVYSPSQTTNIETSSSIRNLTHI